MATKNIQRHAILFLLIILSLSLHAQITPQTRFIQNGVGARAFIDIISAPPPGLDGSQFFDDNWHVGTLHLTNGEVIEHISIRYDIANLCLEVQTDETIKVCPTNQLKSFDWYNFTTADSTKFVTLPQYSFDGDPFICPFEVLVEGRISLYSKIALEIQEPNYLPALDIGEPDRKVLRKERYYIKSDSKVIELSSKMRNNLIHFEPYMTEIHAYAKEERLKSRKRNDLILLIKYYNTLTELNNPQQTDIRFSANNSSKN